MTKIAPRNAFYPHARVQSIPIGDSRTKQAFKKETDINHILRQSEKGLMVTHLNAHQGQYGDFIDAKDYHSSLNLIHAAQQSFMTIPAGVRSKFDNDPQKFLEFVQNPDNLDAMIKMGLSKGTLPIEPSSEGETTPETQPPATDAPAPPA